MRLQVDVARLRFQRVVDRGVDETDDRALGRADFGDRQRQRKRAAGGRHLGCQAHRVHCAHRLFCHRQEGTQVLGTRQHPVETPLALPPQLVLGPGPRARIERIGQNEQSALVRCGHHHALTLSRLDERDRLEVRHAEAQSGHVEGFQSEVARRQWNELVTRQAQGLGQHVDSAALACARQRLTHQPFTQRRLDEGRGVHCVAFTADWRRGRRSAGTSARQSRR